MGCSTTGDDRRTPAQSEPNDQEQSKYRARSYGDSLEKPKKKNTQSHCNIVRRFGSLGEITMVILTILDGVMATQQGPIRA